MTDYPWVIDSVEVVHHPWCLMIAGGEAPVRYGSLAKDNAEMIEHLARPDVSNNHEGPSPLQACGQCVKGEPIDEC